MDHCKIVFFIKHYLVFLSWLNSLTFYQYKNLTGRVNFLKFVFFQKYKYILLSPSTLTFVPTSVIGSFHTIEIIVFSNCCAMVLYSQECGTLRFPPRRLTWTIFMYISSSSSSDFFIWCGEWAFWNLGAVTYSLQRQPVAPR